MKVGGSYDSIVLGVSQQVPQDRRIGQHHEQINFISDPVRGLARRWGSVWEQELPLGALTDVAVRDFPKMREYSFVIDSVEYAIVYRAHASAAGQPTFLFCYNKTAREYVPVEYQAGSALINALVSGGVSAVTCVGRYLYIAGNDIKPVIEKTQRWDTPTNKGYMVGWVRAGAYSRTYKLTLTRADDTTLEVEYKTMPSAYPGVLDTSDIPFYMQDPEDPTKQIPDPEYSKLITDRTNEYNTAVTQHIGLAAEDITPENIAQKLADLLIIEGVTVTTVGGSVCIQDDEFVDVSTEDGGDGGTFLGVGNEVSSADKLSFVHYVGKVVRVRPQGAQGRESFYLEAHAKSGAGTGWQEVIWREAAGELLTPVTTWAFAVMAEGKLSVADRPGNLPASSGPHPPIFANQVGDSESCPIPNFYGRVVTMLCVFQDRLMVGSEGVVSGSIPGEYLNNFRQTVLDVRDNDPLEMFAYGSEGDVLRESALFDRDLVIFGDQKQYAVSGRSVLSARGPNIAVMSSHEDSTQARPVASGNLVFYGKEREGRTSVHQIQVGQLAESPESFEITQQLDTYLKGKPAQIVALTSPNTLVFRTESQVGGLYVYHYIDTPAGTERVFDAWSSWDYARLGQIASVSAHKGELLVFMLRQAGGQFYLTADRQSLSTELSARPYMDSMKNLVALDGWHGATAGADLWAAFDRGHRNSLFGSRLDNLDTLLSQTDDPGIHMWVGYPSPARVTPTNPYVRDRNGKAVLAGRYTLMQVGVSYADSAAAHSLVVRGLGRETERELPLARTLGNSLNVIDSQPVVSGEVHVAIGAEIRECSYTLRSETWLPLTITALSWVGQAFNRVRRA